MMVSARERITEQSTVTTTSIFRIRLFRGGSCLSIDRYVTCGCEMGVVTNF